MKKKKKKKNRHNHLINPNDPIVQVTKIKNRWHARLMYKEEIYDEMACTQRIDIGYICRTMLRWFDKCGGMSKFAEQARHRLNTKPPFGFQGKIYYRNELETQRLRKSGKSGKL